MKITDINLLENKTYKISLEQVKKKFNGNLTHHSQMRFLLNILGVEEQAIELINYNKLFSKEVIAFMESYLIAEKYKVQVYIKKSQTEVYEAIDDTSNPNRIFPPPDTIYIWLVSEDFINYDTSFIRVQLGDNVAKDFKQREITLSYLENFILEQIKNELQLNIFSKKTVDNEVKESLDSAVMRLGINDDLEADQVQKEVFDTNPALYIGVKAVDTIAQEIENLKFKENRWNPRLKDFKPVLEGSTKDNAMICGLVNGLIDAAKAIPELVKLVYTLRGSNEEWEKFKESITQLFTNEEVFDAFLQAITKDYKDSVETGNIEKLIYTMAHDAIAVVSILIGLYGLAKGIAGLLNFIRKALLYIRRYGIKSVAKLKKLKPKQIEEVFDEIERIELFSKVKGKPINPKLLKKLQKDFKKLGGEMKFDDESFAYCAYREKVLETEIEAITLNEDLILLNKTATKSAVYEELIHARQFRSGRFNKVASKYGNKIAENVIEKEAAEELLENAVKLDLPEEEVIIIEERLEYFINELNKLGYEN